MSEGAFESVQRGIGALVEMMADWWEALARPGVVANRLLDPALSSKERVTEVLKLWVVAFLLTLLLEIPMHKLVGIQWNDVDFYLPASIVLFLAALAAAVVIHHGLRIVGIDSKLEDTLALYTVRGAPSYPLIVLLNYPIMIKAVSAIKAAKMQDLAAWDAMKFVLAATQPGNHPSPIDWFHPVLTFLSQILSVALLYLFARSVVAYYGTERFQTYSGIGLGIYVLSVVPVATLTVLYFFVIYVAVKL